MLAKGKGNSELKGDANEFKWFATLQNPIAEEECWKV